MNYLLIDFGASNIKSVLYNSLEDTLSNPLEFPSLFLKCNKVKKNKVEAILDIILSKYPRTDTVITCSILGGYYVEDIYYSWKDTNKPDLPLNPKCLVGGLFDSKIHKHHALSINQPEYIENISLIGTYKGIPFLSSLGDTECALKSISLNPGELIMNLGTGSQVTTYDNRFSFIPSGRMFLMFNKFFNSLGMNFFKDLKQITINDLICSTLKCDLNVFPQSYEFKSGGSITGILEDNFTYNNLLSSILKSYINQYKEYIDTYKPTKIHLIGGIPKKLPIIQLYLKHLYPKIVFNSNNTKYADTHLGLINYIKEYENTNNRREWLYS